MKHVPPVNPIGAPPRAPRPCNPKLPTKIIQTKIR